VKKPGGWAALNVALIVIAMALTTVLVYVSGGAQSIAINFYYLPIIWAGYVGGDMGAMLAALVAALLCGPQMPQDATATDPALRNQGLIEVVVRTLFFFVVGLGSSRISFTLRRRATEFQTLYEVARTVSSSLRLESVLNLIVDSAAQVMNVKACAIRLLEPDTGLLTARAARGLSDAYLAKGPVRVAESAIDQRVLRGETVTIMNAAQDPDFQYGEDAAREGLTSVLSVPLRSRGEALGVIRVYAHSERHFDRDEIALLEAFANQAAVAIENASLYEDIRRNYYETVRALTIAIEARDPATYGHSERVTAVCQRLADRLHMTSDQKELLRFGTILHDIGKIGVEKAALDARQSESMEQRLFYEMHPLIGRSIIAPVEFLQPICAVVLHHHEHWDGTGFPGSLKGEAIPFDARLVAVVDAYDRLVHGLEGQEGMDAAAAFEVIEKAAGSQFDPALVEVFAKMKSEEVARSVLGEDAVARLKES
jgi:HD-GYP domain-containing protein (c-di-GMP phosphodiesterase class II)